MKKHHLDRGKGMVECGKSIKEGMPIAFREGIQFFSLPMVTPIKSIEVCGICLKVNCPGIAKQLAKRQSILIETIAKPPIKSIPAKKPKSIPKPKKVQLAEFNYPCKVNKHNKCNMDIPFDCQLCHKGIELVHLKRVPVIQYKKSATPKSIPIKPESVKPNSKVKQSKGPIQSKLEKDPAVKKLMDVLFPGQLDKSDKGKVRELRKTGKLKVTNAPAIEAQFNKDDKPIELKASAIVDPELIKRVKLNYSLRNVGMHPISDKWIVLQAIGNDVKIISKVTDYKTAFAEFNRHIMKECEKELKANSKKK